MTTFSLRHLFHDKTQTDRQTVNLVHRQSQNSVNETLVNLVNDKVWFGNLVIDKVIFLGRRTKT